MIRAVLLAAVLACDDVAPRSLPVEVTYRTGELVRFIAEPDGVLRATETPSGLELWRYAPPDLDATHRAAGLISDVRIARFDDRVWAYFGMRRGGRSYYALDASDRTSATLLWSRGPADLPGIGETWSAPVVARVRVGGAPQNEQQLVVVVGGGYGEDAGNRVFMLDAQTGAVLWSGALPGMTRAIPARVAVLDTDGDAFADRLYVPDVGGRLWRFDIWNGNEPDELITGGILALLGEGARGFFQAPDVALVSNSSGAYFSLALGSGDPGLTEAAVPERFYSIRDRNPFRRLTQAQFDALPPILDVDLADATASVPRETPGWKFDLPPGERVLSEATTANGTILFTTFAPSADCLAEGTNRVYALRIESAQPSLDLDGDHAITEADVSLRLTQTAIAPALRITLPGGADLAADPAGPSRSTSHCWIGGERLPVCVSIARVRRTFWQHSVNTP